MTGFHWQQQALSCRPKKVINVTGQEAMTRVINSETLTATSKKKIATKRPLC